MKRPDICPCCYSKEIFEHLYEQKFSENTHNEYVQMRLNFMRENWYKCDIPTVSWLLCRSCGFIFFSPRPSDVDLVSKYEVLSGSIKLSSVCPPKVPYQEALWRKADPLGIHFKRARDLFEVTNQLLPPQANILDYGGAAGTLMEHFLLVGHNCGVIDYSVHSPLPGVQYFGSEIDNVSRELRFDMIVVSHVLEHLADPVSIIKNLIQHLKPDGFIYVEVPCEILGGPRPPELVTHTNYFSRTSLLACLSSAGARVQHCLYSPYHSYDGVKRLAIRSISTRGNIG